MCLHILFAVFSQGAFAGDAEITLKAGAANASATGKRQHKPFVLTKPIDKSSPRSTNKKKAAPKPHKAGDVTLKRGVMNNSSVNPRPAAKKKGHVDASWQIEEAEK